MVTGIESIGLALAVIPVVVEVIEGYGAVVTNRDARFLAESLRNHERIFLNSVETLLRSIISSAEVRILLDDLRGDSWSSGDLNERVVDHLGDEAGGILETVDGIYSTVLQLKEKLPTPPPNGMKDLNKISRVKQVVKGFVQGPHYRTSLTRLKSRISEFRMLTDDAIKLGSSRRQLPRKIKNLALIREGADNLYRTLLDSWHCQCSSLHPAHMRLDNFSPMSQIRSNDGRMTFSFLFADDARYADASHWRRAEIVPADVVNDTAQKSGDNSDAQNQTPSLTSTNSLPTTPSSRVAFVSERPAVDADTSDSSGEDDGLPDLCSAFNNVTSQSGPARVKLGTMSDSQGRRYDLYTTTDRITSTPRRMSTSVVELLDSRRSLNKGSHTTQSSRSVPRLEAKDRAGLALILAWAVLRLSPTNWLGEHWTKENILVVLDPPSRPQPYVRHRFQSRRNSTASSNASTLTPSSTNNVGTWVQNEALFALAVFILEMCYSQSIEDMAEENEKGPNDRPHDSTVLLTAMRLAKKVQNEFGMNYAHAVNACLNCDFAKEDGGTTQDKEKLAQGILKHVIAPLESVVDSFGPSMLAVPVH